MRLAAVLFGSACVVLTLYELLDFRRSKPSSLFNEVFEILRINDDIVRMAGGNMKAFGRDVGRSTEGRRNHVDSFAYKGPDGSNRSRVRFNVKGDKGKVVVWAEVRTVVNLFGWDSAPFVLCPLSFVLCRCYVCAIYI
jgi:hypothetical protein